MASRFLPLLALALVSAAAFSQAAPAPTSKPATTLKPGVQQITLSAASDASLKNRKSSYKVTVSGSDWVDTKFQVAPGDTLTLKASGAVTLGDGRKVTADGVARGWKDLLRQFPDNNANAGELVGRIGNSAATVPFEIGATKTLDAPTSGELYLAINASTDLSPTGSYSVTIDIARKASAGAGDAAAVTGFLKAVTPALFANVPRRVHDLQNNPGDMVNFAMVGTEDQVKQAFQAAGWVPVDKSDQAAVLNGLLKTLQHESYLTMPMSTLYLFGRPQDLSFARADPLTVVASRHHLRVWKSDETIDGKPLWVGSSTHDIGFERDQRNNGVTHKIDPDIDKERDFLEQSFADAGDLDAAAYVTPSDPLTTAKTATGGSFHSDGRIVVMLLK